jgi:hypothetical protein
MRESDIETYGQFECLLGHSSCGKHCNRFLGIRPTTTNSNAFQSAGGVGGGGEHCGGGGRGGGGESIGRAGGGRGEGVL